MLIVFPVPEQQQLLQIIQAETLLDASYQKNITTNLLSGLKRAITRMKHKLIRREKQNDR